MRLHFKNATAFDAAAVDDLLADHALTHTGRRSPTGTARAKLTTPSTASAIITAATVGSRRALGFVHVWRDGSIARFLAVVRPGVWGTRAIGESLLNFAERRAADTGATILKTHQCARDADFGALLASRSYRVATGILQMRAELTTHPSEAAAMSTLPAGIEVTRFDPDLDTDRLFAVVHEAFPEESDDEQAWWRDHLDNPTRPFEPSLWFVARDGDGDILGFALGSRRVDGDRVIGYLGGLGVRVAERGRGVGRALLGAVMDAFVEAGCSAMTLSVAAGNRTGALSLYRGLGMTETPESTEWMTELDAAPSLRAVSRETSTRRGGRFT